MISRSLSSLGLGILVLAGGTAGGFADEAFRLKENLRIGKEEKSQESVFSMIRAIQADDAGQIYVLDSREALVKVFDSKGRFLFSFGKRGQGPGDLQGPLGMSLSGGVISINNFGNKRISKYKTNGVLLKEVDFRAAGSLFRAEIEMPGAVFGNIIEFRENGSQTLKLVRFDVADQSLRIIAESGNKATFPEIDPMAGTYILRCLPNGKLICVYTGEYALNIFSAEGKAEMRRDHSVRPAVVTEEDREILIKKVYGGMEKIPPEWKFIWPKYHPPLSFMVVADNGWIILKTNTKNDRGWYQYDVFDEKCDFMGCFYHNGRENLHAVKSGQAYFSTENDEGEIIIKRYEIIH